MRKSILLGLILFLGAHGLFAQAYNNQIITTDVDNFWIAYDQINKTNDSLERIRLIHELYIDKGTEGLKGLMAVRRYQDYEFVNNIVNYPNYWNSIRGNTAGLSKDAMQIDTFLTRLKAIYPALKPSPIYFSVGAFRSGATYEGNKVLFGAEFMLSSQSSRLDELPERIQQTISTYAPYDIPLIALHESIHTQQKRWEDQSILHLCVGEGVAEFISTLISGKPLSPPVKFGKENPERVLQQFMVEIFRDADVWNWLWNQNQNPLKVNDLGYYIGYEICERYYNNAADKHKAIKDLIELDYSNEAEFAAFVDGTGFLPMTWKEIGRRYESMRPTVLRIVEFKNGSQKVSPALHVITIEFSEPMSSCCRSIDFDETEGVERLIITQHLGWSDDKKRYSFVVEDLKPHTTYGLIISNFAKENGQNRLAPYTIRFKTKK